MSPAVELRYGEIRAVAGDGRTVAGRVVSYGDEADIGGAFIERIEPGAFSGRAGDVVLNLAHDRTLMLARTGGGGLEIDDRAGEMTFEARLPSTTAAADALELIRSGVVRGVSVEMAVDRDKWSERGTRRVISEARLYGLGLVARPAYPQSSVALRDALYPAKPVSLHRRPWGV